MDRRLIVGVPNTITLKLHNPHPRRVRVTLRDDLPPGWEASPPEHTVELPGYARRELTYTVVPPKRGRFRFGDLHLKLEGAAKLGARIVTLDRGEEARVF